MIMKAYTAQNDEGFCICVFAESAGKAKSYLKDHDLFIGYEYCDISVNRRPVMDKYYRDHKEMDWYDPEDRIALVKELSWVCMDESGAYDFSMCDTCSAKEFCFYYQDSLQEEA